MLADSSSWAPHVEVGKLRLLATWGEQRTARFKDVPTLKETGFNVVVDAPNGVGTPILYLDGPDYEQYVLQTFKKETQLIQRLNLKALKS